MKAIECLAAAKAAGEHYQHPINLFIDEFRFVDATAQWEMVKDPIEEQGQLEGLIAGVVSYLCREAGIQGPKWLEVIGSPDPFFVLPAKSYAMRVRLMLESPPPFKIRRVFVPENYMSRA